jgi:3-methyladenine DNA glycosylase AlkD
MTLKEALAKLESLGDEKRRAWNVRNGAGKAKTFGCATGDIRALARKIKTDHALALELWKTGNIDAQLLAILIMRPKELSAKELDKMVRTARFAWVADWLNAYIVKEQPPADKETLRIKWMDDEDGWAARAGWNLTASRIAQAAKAATASQAPKRTDAGADGGADALDLSALLDRIEAEMAAAPPEAQWTMNAVLANIGIHEAKLRKRAIAIGEKLGIYRDYPCSKGCTSPFAPIWINEMVKRQG